MKAGFRQSLWACAGLCFACSDSVGFIEQPWPDDHSAVAVWIDASEEVTRLSQAAPGEGIRLDLPFRDGRLYVRTYAPEVSIGGHPASECPASLEQLGIEFPSASTFWSSESVRGVPDEIQPESAPQRALGLRAPTCTPAAVDLCAGIRFEHLSVPDDFNPASVARIGDDAFFVAGSSVTRPTVARLLSYAQGELTEIALTSTAVAIAWIRPDGTSNFHAITQPRKRLVRFDSAGRQISDLGGGFEGVSGVAGYSVAYSDTQVFELHPEMSERFVELTSPPEAIDSVTVFGDQRLALLGDRNVFLFSGFSWDINNPTEAVASRLQVVGGTRRLYLLGTGETLFVYDTDGVWRDEGGFSSMGNTRPRTAIDFEDGSFMVGGDRVIAINSPLGWCLNEDPRFRYVDLANLDAATAVAVSRDDSGTEALITLVYH